MSTPVVDGGPFPDLPPPPWPQPDTALARHLDDLELSDAATFYPAVVSESQAYPFVLPTTRSHTSLPSGPESSKFSPPPVRQDHVARCDPKKPCSLCRGLHLCSLHDVNFSPPSTDDSATVVGICHLATPLLRHRDMLLLPEIQFYVPSAAGCGVC